MFGVSFAHSSILLISGSNSKKGEPGMEFAFDAILEIEDIDSLSEMEPARERHSMSPISLELSAMNARFSLLLE